MFLVSLWQVQVNAEIVDNQEEIMPNSCIGPELCLEQPDPGGGGGGDEDDTSKELNLEVGFYNTFDYFTKYGEKHYYYFTAPKDGYYNFHVKSDDLFGYEIGLDVSLREHKVDGNTIFSKSYYSEYYYDSYNNDNQYYFTQGEEYSLIISNSSMEPENNGKYYLEIEVRDDNSDANKANIDVLAGGQVASTIDYEGDVDYYTFTNLGGYYDIYSTGYGNGNIDMKAELFLCDPSCTTKVTYNDDYNSIATDANHEKISPLYPNMGSRDFGFRIDLGYGNDTYKKLIC